MSKKRRVVDIMTSGVEESEYMKLYRARDTAERIDLAREMGVLDKGWAEKVANSLRGARRGYCVLMWAMFMGGIHITAYVIAQIL